MNTAEKRAETKAVKALVERLGFDRVRVTHGGHGWLDIEASTNRPEGCDCWPEGTTLYDNETWDPALYWPTLRCRFHSTSYGIGSCQDCAVVWYEGWDLIKAEVKDLTGRNCHPWDGAGYVNVNLKLQGERSGVRGEGMIPGTNLRPLGSTVDAFKATNEQFLWEQ